MKKKLFECSFTEYNGEQEYRYEKLVRADTEKKARKIFVSWLKDWYEDEDVEVAKENGQIIGYEFFAGCLAVGKIYLDETTEEAFKKRKFNQALIN